MKLLFSSKTFHPKTFYSFHHRHVTLMNLTHKLKLLVIMGSTGSGKSKLSIDLATKHFPESEIINSDKIQLYRGLDITTNKTPFPDRKGVPHHLLGVADPKTDLPASEFCSAAAKIISSISHREKLPVLVGGSNSIIYTLISNHHVPESDTFNPKRTELRYDCCFIWVDVETSVLDEYLNKRVDEMMCSGMLAELANWFKTEGFSDTGRVGLGNAIGVPEFESYFKKYLFCVDKTGNDPVRACVSEDAVRLIKYNSCQLARRQIDKIQRLRDKAGWEMNKIDATAAFKAVMSGGDVAGVWEQHVVVPSVKIVRQFLEE